jgi:membrane fusion protein (multidrug efflux system)
VNGQFNSNTASVTFRVNFDNPKTILHAGNTGKILIKQNFDNVVLIPIASTTTVQDKIYVFSLDKENKTVQKSIEIAGKSGTDYMVTDGIKSGDRYIISGFERLQPGMPVIPKSSNEKKAAQKNTAADKQKG